MGEAFQPEWVQQAKIGKQKAFGKLYLYSYSTVYLTVRLQIKGDEDTVFDLVQDTYIKAFNSISQLREEEKFLPWIRTIARRTAIDWLRKKQPLLFMVSLSDEEETEEIQPEEQRKERLPEQHLSQQETQYLMKQLIESLSARQRMVISLYYYENMSIQEISEAIGCTAGTIRVLLHQGRKTLKDRMQELQNRGVELYGLAPIPFFLFLLHNWSRLEIVPNPGITSALLLQKITDELLADNQLPHVPMASQGKFQAIRQFFTIKRGIIAASIAAVLFSGMVAHSFLPQEKRQAYPTIWNAAPLVSDPKQEKSRQAIRDTPTETDARQLNTPVQDATPEQRQTNTTNADTDPTQTNQSEPNPVSETTPPSAPTRDIAVTVSDQVWVVDVPAHDGELSGGFDVDDEEDSFVPAYVYCTTCGFKIPYNESVEDYQTEDGVTRDTGHKRLHGRDMCTGTDERIQWKYSDEPYLKHYEEEGHYETISLSQGTVNLRAGETEALSVTVTPALEDGSSIVWSSDSPDVATVSDGVVTGVSSGNAAITATTPHGATVVASILVRE